MHHLFVIDPLENLLPDKDTTIAFMREAQSRGYAVLTCHADRLGLGQGARPYAHVVTTRMQEGDPWYAVEPAGRRYLDEFDVIWMRKDPPFDMDYFYATHLLSMVSPPALVVNDPGALRDANEKLFALRFPEVCPESLVAKSMEELLAFREELGGEMIVKPLGGAGGEGVFHLARDDRNVRAILETATRHGSEYLLAQRYVPEVREGDKRIILVEGEAGGAVLRVPRSWEARANFHVGGTPERTEMTARDKEICSVVGPTLREEGILFAGIDVIGEWLTEVNVTSPTGIREIYDLDGISIERDVFDAVEQRSAKGALDPPRHQRRLRSPS
jgi:glutathione synthase